MRFAVSENRNADKAWNGTKNLAVDIETQKNWVIWNQSETQKIAQQNCIHDVQVPIRLW
jgi:hypothetical protein